MFPCMNLDSLALSAHEIASLFWDRACTCTYLRVVGQALHACYHAAGSQHVSASGYLDEELLDELDDDDELDEDELHNIQAVIFHGIMGPLDIRTQLSLGRLMAAECVHSTVVWTVLDASEAGLMPTWSRLIQAIIFHELVNFA
jgi:hypothetical protein